jgi:hypothetical protein
MVQIRIHFKCFVIEKRGTTLAQARKSTGVFIIDPNAIGAEKAVKGWGGKGRGVVSFASTSISQRCVPLAPSIWRVPLFFPNCQTVIHIYYVSRARVTGVQLKSENTVDKQIKFVRQLPLIHVTRASK